MMKVVVLEEHYLHTNFHSKQLKTRGARCPIYWFFWHFLSSWPWPWDENEKSSSVGLCRCHWANQIPKPLSDSTNPSGKMDFYVKIRNFLSLWPWPWDENEKSSSVGLCRCHWANQIPKPLTDATNPLGEDANWNRLPPKNTCFFWAWLHP